MKKNRLPLITILSFLSSTMFSSFARANEDPYFWWNVGLDKAVAIVGSKGYKIYGEQPALELSITLKNEESIRGVSLPEDFRDLIEFQLQRGGVAIPIRVDWTSQVRKSAVDPNTRVDLENLFFLEPDAYIELSCRLKPIGSQPLEYGEYSLSVHMKLLDWLRFEDGTKWQGRAGRVFDLPFLISEIKTKEDLKTFLGVEGSYYFSRKEYLKALEYYQRQLQADPSDLGPHGSMGMVYVQLGQFREAIPHLEKAIVLGGRTIIPYNLAYAYTGVGNEKKARDTLRIIMSEDQVQQKIKDYKAQLKQRR